MSLNFDLPAFDSALAGDVSMTLDGRDIDYARDVSHSVVIEVDESHIRNTFRYIVDASDVNDISLDDIQYFVVPDQFPTVNVAHAMADYQGYGLDYTATAIATGYEQGKSLMKDDFMRYVAKRLFNTHHGVDLISNESEISKDLTMRGEDVWTTILTKLQAGGTQEAPLTDEDDADTNLTRELLRHIILSTPDRLKDEALAGGVDQGGRMIRSVPVIAGDSISFNVTVDAASGQHDLTGVAAIPPRVYRVQLVVISETAEFANYVPSADGIPTDETLVATWPSLDGSDGGEPVSPYAFWLEGVTATMPTKQAEVDALIGNALSAFGDFGALQQNATPEEPAEFTGLPTGFSGEHNISGDQLQIELLEGDYHGGEVGAKRVIIQVPLAAVEFVATGGRITNLDATVFYQQVVSVGDPSHEEDATSAEAIISIPSQDNLDGVSSDPAQILNANDYGL